METHVEHLAKLFMENDIQSFGMVEILVVDADSKFKNISKDICAALEIIYWTLVCGNHKGTSIEKYQHFINKI